MRKTLRKACVLLAFACVSNVAVAQAQRNHTVKVRTDKLAKPVTIADGADGIMKALNREGYSIHYLHKARDAKTGRIIRPSEYGCRPKGSRFRLNAGTRPSHPARTWKLMAAAKPCKPIVFASNSKKLAGANAKISELEKKVKELEAKLALPQKPVVVAYAAITETAAPPKVTLKVGEERILHVQGVAVGTRVRAVADPIGGKDGLRVGPMNADRSFSVTGVLPGETGLHIEDMSGNRLGSKVVTVQPDTTVPQVLWYIGKILFSVGAFVILLIIILVLIVRSGKVRVPQRVRLFTDRVSTWPGRARSWRPRKPRWLP